MKKAIQQIIHPFYKKYHFWYHKKARKFKYRNVYTIVQPSVFSPIHTVSTKIFLDFIDDLDLADKKVLELGCGSGIISILSANKGADITASDINKIALESLLNVAKEQNLKVKTMLSDLFKNINNIDFDYIFINPPFYPKNPINTEEKAWYCGENFEYFHNLFEQLPNYLKTNTNCYMILSSDCDFETIQQLAIKHKLSFKIQLKKKTFFETNYIYKISKNS